MEMMAEKSTKEEEEEVHVSDISQQPHTFHTIHIVYICGMVFLYFENTEDETHSQKKKQNGAKSIW